MQVWYARIVNIFNLVEMPLSVLDLFVLGKNRVFHFVESFNPLNMRKEMENYLHAIFQFWAIPDIRKLLEKNQFVSLLKKIAEIFC